MSTSKDTLETRCRRIWEEICRDWAAVIEAKRRDDAQQRESQGRKQVETDDSSEDGLVEDDISDNGDPIESSDISITVVDYDQNVNSTIDRLLRPIDQDHKRWESMDTSLDLLLRCSVPSWEKTNLEPVSKAVSIIERLPNSPLQMSPDLWSVQEDSSADIGEEAGRTNSSTRTHGEVEWNKLETITTVDSNTVRLALLTAFLDQKSHRGLCDATSVYANLLSEIMDKITALEAASSMEIDKAVSNDSYRTAITFVWTTWQRWLQVSGYYLFGTRLRRERVHEDWAGTTPEPYEELELGINGNSTNVVDPAEGACDYMCRHSFDLVKLSIPGSPDLRTVIHRYNTQFGQKNARCYEKGSVWYHCDPTMAFCTRCIQASPKDQSAHDQTCPGNCRRLVWDEESYRSTRLSKSVDISLPLKDGTLRYRTATDQTLAISHVWSHGQGGRPEDGFNECLHNRYSDIASRLGCDSYWIDAACIPSDEVLRAEAIKTINPTFRDSKVTLICDKDIMSIDAQDMSREQCETLISVLLLSDWNLRAWTLLEGIRGNRSIHLLSKDKNPIALRDILSVLYNEGNVDLCGVLLGSPHLLPMVDEINAVELERAGVMLSRRFASRPGDDIIIWSLLRDDKTVVKKPELFWRNTLGCSVKSGFLMSTCERVKGVRGLSWAPSSPFADPLAINISSVSSVPTDTKIYAPYDGSGTVSVKPMEVSAPDCNTALHLRGYWSVYIVQPSDFSRVPKVSNSCWERAEDLLQSKEYKRVIFIRPILSRPYNVGYMESPSTGPQHVIDGGEAPVTVCATKDDRETFDVYRIQTELQETNELWGEEWEWKGVYKEAPPGSIGETMFEIRILRII